jgi:hypothetical protein
MHSHLTTICAVFGDIYMAVSVIPKSEFRKNENIVEGYGEVPAVHIVSPDGDIITGWGLPDGSVTTREKDARAFARKLDEVIRRNMRSTDDLLVSPNS